MEIRKRVAVVTGASVGTGRAIACRLAAEGAAVIVADIDTAGGEETRRMIAAAGGDARFVTADLRRELDVGRMIAAAVACFRPPGHSDQQRRRRRACPASLPGGHARPMGRVAGPEPAGSAR